MQVNVLFLLLPLYFETSEVFTTLAFLTSGTPNHFALYSDYSNSFNPITEINLYIMTFIVYDISGIEIINNEEMKMGGYTVDFNGKSLSSGIYIYVLETTEFPEARKMILQK